MTLTDPPSDTPLATPDVARILSQYQEPLLRKVASQLLKPRNQWPVEELVERCVQTLDNPPVIDRRLKELPVEARRLLALIALSRQSIWSVGQLLPLLACLGHTDGLIPIFKLLEMGFLYPIIPEEAPPLRMFESWLGIDGGGMLHARVYAPSSVVDRARDESFELPEIPSTAFESVAIRTGDTLEWFLRIAVIRGQLLGNPLRLTLQQALFKRDLTRLQSDPLLNAPFADHLVDLVDAGLAAMTFATACGVLEIQSGELHAASNFPQAWERGTLSAMQSLWSSLFSMTSWDPVHGYRVGEEVSPFPSMALVTCLFLSRVSADRWVRPEVLARELWNRHPSWAAQLNQQPEQGELWLRRFLLGIALPLRIVEATQHEGSWWVRLGDVGRHLIRNESTLDLTNSFTQMLIVQPNSEMVVYRQGLTPALIAKFSRFANWKAIGAACMLELTAESVYRGLETGLTVGEMVQVLQQHSTRPLPPNVLDALQRWANKRDRITVFASATLLEFGTPEDLEAAFVRGLISVKITDRIGLAGEGEIDYSKYRLLGNRNYESRPQQCVTFDADGITFTIDSSQSDLFLEAELARFSEPLSDPSPNRRRYALTFRSLRAARQQGVSIAELDKWCIERSGSPLSAAGRLLYGEHGETTGAIARWSVVQFPTESITDGVVQWPVTARYVKQRLGPCAVTVAEEDREEFLRELAGLGIQVSEENAEAETT